MPFLPILLLGGGFGVGYLTGTSVNKLLLTAGLAGAGYYAYTKLGVK